MKGTAKTRSQRRLEKRQAIILLVLVLTVSLASFTLGVIVGRRGAERDLAYKLRQTERVLVAQAPAPAASTRPVPIVEPEGKVREGDIAAGEPSLSFYDNLAKDTAPLGSGINLPPASEEPATVAAAKPRAPAVGEPVAARQSDPGATRQR